MRVESFSKWREKRNLPKKNLSKKKSRAKALLQKLCRPFFPQIGFDLD
jgi:hypothetical protein